MKNNKGVTIIALIITIVLLLILSVATIRTARGEGVIGHAKNAKEQTDAKQEELAVKMAVLDANNNALKVQQNLDNKLGTGKTQVEKIGSEIVVNFTGSNNTYCIDDNGNVYLNNSRIKDYHYREVEYIESTGTQYIDTNYKPSGSTKVITDLITKSIPSTNAFFYGARNGIGVNGFASGVQPCWIDSYGSNNTFNVRRCY